MRTLIKNALIVNGDGQTEPYAGDALVDGDRITHLGAVPASEQSNADRVVDAHGRVLAPGFCDMHNHGALGGTRVGEHGLPVACENAVLGGVTRRICGVDGLSPAPVAPGQGADYAETLRSLDGDIGGPFPWNTMGEFYQWHQGRSVTDIGLYLGHSAVRRRVMGNEPRLSTPSELADMCRVVAAEAPDTLGLSTGLIYSPAVFSDTHELTELLRAFNKVKPAALFPHIRNESDNILPSLQEVLQVAVDAGGGYCNEHTKLAGEHNFDKLPQVRALLDDAAANVPFITNMYPYTAGSTTGDAMIPPNFRTGSRAEFLARMKDPTTRRAIWEWIRGEAKSWDNFVNFCGGLEGIQVAGVKAGADEQFLGKRLGDVARAAAAPDLNSLPAFEAVFDFFVANELDVTIILHYGNEPAMTSFFSRPNMAICTDGLMPGPGQKPHPRSIGSFPRALRLAREMNLGLKTIVHRMTALPMHFLNVNSPVLKAGADASLVLFDWETVTERNDYENPYTPPHGIDHVWIHGEHVLNEAKLQAPAHFGGRIMRTTGNAL